MPVSTISIVINSDDPAAVEGYVRDSIENADQEWEIDSATIETDGVTTDLLEDEEDLSDETDEVAVENQSEEETEQEIDPSEEETKKEPRTEPTGKEF